MKAVDCVVVLLDTNSHMKKDTKVNEVQKNLTIKTKGRNVKHKKIINKKRRKQKENMKKHNQ